jgi:hypothetical protein
MRLHSRPRWRTAALSLAVGTACMGGVPGPLSSSASAAVADDCPAPFPVEQLDDTVVGSGLTVSTGTTPEPFTATYVGRVEDGIALDVDMIVMELSGSAALDKAGGVWSGMSGSPVYAQDGRLIGAVSYGLSAGPSKIAGITPAADMYALLSRSSAAARKPAEKVALPAAVRGELAAQRAATPAELARGMRQLPLPLGVTSSAARIDKVAERLQKRLPNTRVFPMGRSSTSQAAAADIAPGSNYAAAVSTGDLTSAAIGTTTAVCDGVALAFGHPFNFAGATTLSAHAAEAVFVQDDVAFAPFKVANLGGMVGTTDQDRLAGIRGRLGAMPSSIPVTSLVRAPGSSRSGSTQVYLHDYVPDIAAEHLLVNADRVLDRIGEGTAAMNVVVSGRRASGAPFRVAVDNRYASGDIASEIIWPVLETVGDIVYNPFEDARVTGVSIDATLTEKYAGYTVGAVYRKRPSGTFAKLSTSAPLAVTAGTRLNLRVALTPYRNVGPAKNVDLSVVVPADMAGGMGALAVEGGAGSGFGFGEEEPPGDSGPASFDELLKQLAGAPRNDAVTAMVLTEKETNSGTMRRTRSARANAGEVVSGSTFVPISVVAPRGATAGVVDGNVWKMRSGISAGKPARTVRFGLAGDRKLMGDWDGNGVATPAVFRKGTWYIRTSWAGGQKSFRFGSAKDIPVVGDWDGDGRDSIGVYRAGRWFLRNSLSSGAPDAGTFTFGNASTVPVVGDWDGDGRDSAGHVRNGTWSVRNGSTGPADSVFRFGRKGDLPVAGDWDRDGRDEPGVYRRGQWFLRNKLATGSARWVFRYGSPKSRPVVGS